MTSAKSKKQPQPDSQNSRFLHFIRLAMPCVHILIVSADMKIPKKNYAYVNVISTKLEHQHSAIF